MCLHVFDVFLGLLFMTWMLTDDRTDKMASHIMDWAEVSRLLHPSLMQYVDATEIVMCIVTRIALEISSA